MCYAIDIYYGPQRKHVHMSFSLPNFNVIAFIPQTKQDENRGVKSGLMTTNVARTQGHNYSEICHVSGQEVKDAFRFAIIVGPTDGNTNRTDGSNGRPSEVLHFPSASELEQKLPFQLHKIPVSSMRLQVRNELKKKKKTFPFDTEIVRNFQTKISGKWSAHHALK